MLIAGSVVATLLVTLVVLNLMPVGARIEHRIERLYELGSPQFFRSIGVLLGPPTLAGNRVEALQNGDEIFPVDAGRDPEREAHDHVRDLHLLVRRHGPRVRRRAVRARARRRARARAARLGRLAEDRRDARSRRCARRASRSSCTGRCTGITWRGSTTGRIGSCSSWMAASDSPAASASPTSGRATRRIPSTGVTATTAPKGRSSRRCRRRSSTTGPR